MIEVNNPHDQLIRVTFQNKKETDIFFKTTLPHQLLGL
ncbi:Rpn family recombination-promoting nuclease/putative transposase [Leptospira noguchii]|uniref:Transposase (putative) YhgA-like domain-containing protein n=1 Tax=Leptospira noguchii serovar Panama str. CZ214 TaxID=1001595 RepID=T0GQQ1_9LEPT|nr:hypothetical protein LEP1GSC059_2673 [Leptospira noguchii serovar Panama str. CZ214]